MRPTTVDSGAPQVGDDLTIQLNACQALHKLKSGDLHLISIENAQELFDILCQGSDQGELSPDDLRILRTIPELNLTDDDIENLIRDCDKDDSKQISVTELLKALQQGSLVYKTVLDELDKGPKVINSAECTRDQLIDFLREEHETNEALCSLPITMLSFVLFIFLVIFHFDLRHAYSMQNAIQAEVEGEGKPYLGTSVHDIPTFWDWMDQSYVGAQFKSTSAQLKDYPNPGRFASFNQIIGGTQVIKHQIQKHEKCSQANILAGYYDSYGFSDGYSKSCTKRGDENTTSEFFLYHIGASHLKQHASNLNAMNWVDQGTTHLDFRNLYYNAHLGLFTDFSLTFAWQPDGFVKILFNMESYQADPYYNKLLVVLDVVYALIMVRMLYAELKEMIPRMLNGLDGFIQYWEFWNIIDWVNIVLGTISFVVWGLIIVKVSGNLQDAISALPTRPLDEWVRSNQTYFSEPELTFALNFQGAGSISDYEDKVKKVHELSGEIASLHKSLRAIFFFYSLSLMMKFFKAFQANPRLNIVVMTMSDSAVDITHFGIVFLTIFFVFSLMAHVEFGAKLLVFSNNFRAFYMTFQILLGDFPMDDMEEVNLGLANLWFFFFQILVMMILLNMLLAIIMDTYTGVVAQGGTRKTIWQQVREAVNTLRETRGHLSLLYLRCEMEDEDNRAHPQQKVTVRSLRNAFARDKMHRKNAEYLLRRVSEWLKDKEEESDLTLTDAIRLVGQTKTLVMRIRETTEKTYGMLKAAERAPMEARHDAIMAGFDPDDPHFAEQMKAASNSDKIMPIGKFATGPPLLANGIPYNGHGGFNGHAAFGGPPAITNINNVNNGIPPPHPLGIHDDPNRLETQLMPFDPSNAHNARFDGTLSSRNPKGNNSPAIGFDNSFGQNFDNTGQSFSNMVSTPPASHMSGNQMSGTPQRANTNSPPPSHGYDGGTMPAQAVNLLLEKMSDMQRNMEFLARSNSDLQNYISERDAWMEQRFTMLDRRCQKVEVLSDRLYGILRAVNISDIAEVPNQVTKALDMHMDKLDKLEDLHSPNGSPLRDGADPVEGVGLPGVPSHGLPLVPTNTTNRRPGNSDTHKLDDRLNTISDQMEQLLSQADTTQQISKILWRVDLNVRKLTGTAHNLPEGHPLLQQQQVTEQQRRASEQSQSASNRSTSLRPSAIVRGPAGGSRGPSRDPSRGPSKQNYMPFG